ncbi:MAG: hypothetical protein J6T10_08240 [Methanobrevibacter sp.]|nr:hypothetical protein [Methanobrevibacter sp.]
MAIQAAFTLNSNEIFATLANMIISQEVFADNLGKHQTLVDKARVDGGLYGDKKLYYATDVLKSAPWGNDAEASNLLALHRPNDPSVQDINLDVFRQISLTVDNYLTKRAWSTEGAFSSFNGVMLGWLRETKRVYDGTLYNVFMGTSQTSQGAQMQSVDVTTAVGNATGEEANRLEAEAIAQALADLMVEMGDYSRAFNDYGYLRSYAEDAIKVVWNAKFVNKIKKIDLPTIFHKEGLVDKFEEEVLPARYFGTVITASNVASYSASTPAAGKPIDSDDDTYVPGSNHANGCIRAAVEKDINGGSGTASAGTAAQHVFPGDEIPAGSTIKAGGDFELGEVYIEQPDVIAKVVVKLPPYMSAFEVGTSFFNAKSLTENHYLTFGHNTLQYLKNYPFITIKKI